jgi:hypothetical protein
LERAFQRGIQVSNKTAMASEIKDIELAGLGKQRIDWASAICLCSSMISARFEKENPSRV